MAEKAGLIARTQTFFQEVQVEMGKVVWPSWETLKAYTLVVLVATAILSIALGLWDLILAKVVQGIFGVFGSSR